MKKFPILLLLLGFSLVFGQEAKFSDTSLLLKLHPGHTFLQADEDGNTGLSALDQLNKEKNLLNWRCLGRNNPKKSNIERPADRTYVLTFPPQDNIPELAAQYQTLAVVEVAEPDFIGFGGGVEVTQIVPNDANFSRQWGFYNNGTFSFGNPVADADVDMDDAWNVTTGNSSVIAAILDTGTKLDHPEFSGRLWTNGGETPGDGLDNDGNGYGDDINGYDFVNVDGNPADDQGHGTNVMGILGASGNNSIGYAGTDWNCQLMTCKILDSNNSGFYSWWADAFYYATDNGASVINISAGGSGASTILSDAVQYAYDNQVVVVACMMNTDNNTTYYPAGYPTTIAVGSTDPDDSRSSPFPWSTTSGSNFGTHIDVVAPGNYIYGLKYDSNTNYNTYWSGTSQATPLVTGLCGLLRGLDATLTVEEIRTLLHNTAEDQVGDPTEDVAGFDQYHGYGRVNAKDLLALATSRNNPETESGISVYPNPNSGSFHLEWQNAIPGSYNLEIFNLSGQLVWSKIVDGLPLQTLTTETLPNGVYLLKISNSNQEMLHQQKLLIAR